MRKSTRIVKRILALFLVVLMSINTFAAVVGDNDGAAFITKAEFDSLKNNFQAQIDQYNTSIDSKIDGAIASYLSGISVVKKESINIINPGAYEGVSYSTDSASTNVWRYKYGSPLIYADITKFGNNTTAKDGVYPTTGLRWQFPYPDASYDYHSQHRLLLSTVNDTKHTAAWKGFSFNSYDRLVCVNGEWATMYELHKPSDGKSFRCGFFRHGACIPQRTESFSNISFENFAMGAQPGLADFTQELWLKIQHTFTDWGHLVDNNVMLLSGSKPYLNFTRYPNPRNMRFHPSPLPSDSSAYEKLWTDGISYGAYVPSQVLRAWYLSAVSFKYQGAASNIAYQAPEGTPFNLDSATMQISGNFAYRGTSDVGIYGEDGRKYVNWPCIGFEDNIITDWNQIYLSAFDAVARDSDLATFTGFLKDEENTKHVGIVHGIPIVKITNNDSKVTLDIDLTETSYNYQTGAKTKTATTTDSYVWFSDEPFTGYPNDADCLTFEPVESSCEHTTLANFDKAVKVPASKGGKAKVIINAPKKNKYLWVKWTTHGSTGGGTLTLPEKCIIEHE